LLIANTGMLVQSLKIGNKTDAKIRQFVRLWTKLQPVHQRARHHKLAVQITRGIRFIYGTIILDHGCSSVRTRETNNQISLRKLVSPTPPSSVTASRRRAVVSIRRATTSIPRCSPQRARHRRHPPRRGGILHARYAASRPTDCSCCRTQPPTPRFPPPSSMRVLGDYSGSSIPRRVLSCSVLHRT
jgi:hypothetical protein